MARFGPNSYQIKVTTVSSTGAFRDISQQVTEFGGWSPEAILEMVHAFGDSFEESAHVGVNRIADITFRGPYDSDTATGVAGIFFNTTDLGAERVVKLNPIGTTSPGQGLAVKVDVIVQSAKIMPSRGALTQYEVVLRPTGAWTSVTST